MKQLILLLFMLFVYSTANAQISASLMQHPDVSDTQVCFVYGDDVWIAAKKGGTATRLSSPAGAESYPKFSPDGSMIAYTANYQGNSDVYVISVTGGLPKRLTYHGMWDKVLGWTPDGKSVLFASSRESGRQRFAQFFTVSIDSGSPTQLPVPYGAYATFSPDGNKVAFTELSRVNRNWKRYRGGMAPDIMLFDLTTFASENITTNSANDEIPMWVDGAIYYMSDNGPNKRNNIWKYDLLSKSHIQVTHFKDYDITFPGNSNADIVFEAGGKLQLYNMKTGNTSEIKIKVVSDQKELIAQNKKVDKYIQTASVSPDGKRVVAMARGDIFNLPATQGFVTNLTASPGSAERNPAWSPDGKSVAYWSDASGEYQLVIHDMTAENAPRTVTNFDHGFRYDIYWSPDSKKLAFVDQSMNMSYYDTESGEVVVFDKGKYMYEGALRSFNVSWSPDSKWIAYHRSLNTRLLSAVFVYNVDNKKASQLTSGYYSDQNPAFSPDGKYLFFSTNRVFNPVYSDLDNTFVYPNASKIAVGTLQASTESLLKPKNDVLEPAKEESNKDADKGKKDKKSKDDEKEDDKPKPVNIDLDDFEQRVELLDVKPGNIGRLTAVEGMLLFTRFPNSGSPGGAKPSVNYYDIKERKVNTLVAGVSQYIVAANGKKMLVMNNGKLAVIDVKKDQKIEKTVPTGQMVMEVIPKEEWKQIFTDVWRIERDYFYDPNMHGVNWSEMKTKYGTLVDQASSRNDVNIIIGDLIAELNASHTYNGGGDMEKANNMNVGYLGADVSLENRYFRINKIIKGAPWDVNARSPLAAPGVDVKKGDYILAVNGQSLDTDKPISAAFQGLADATVQLTVNSEVGMKDARKVIVKLMKDETRLRHLAWIEHNRQMVEKATGGKIGYVYVRSTGRDGQNELIRQYYGQLDKEGFIIDERFNSGGQIPDRFVELLNRKPLAFFAVRDGKDWSWPPAANFGPKVMLINGFSGSGGDVFPDYFRKSGIGPLIGTRTWGGLIGISGAPTLVDNGSVTVPTFRMYDPDGEWFREGHGVDPDIKVEQDFQKLAQGEDAQLMAAIEEVMKMLNAESNFVLPDRPAYETR